MLADTPTPFPPTLPQTMMIGYPHLHHHNDHCPLHISFPTPSSPPSNATPPISPTAVMTTLLRRHVLESSYDDFDFPSPDDDEFFMYDFKVRMCTRPRAHDWTDCPFAHPGEKARRRDPRKYTYSGTACTDFRKGGCRKGDTCEFAHGVFECWLHPSRYRTQACKDGPRCGRRVCFFAHYPHQLRSGTSPEDGVISVGSGSSSGSSSVAELAASLRGIQLNKVESMPNSWPGLGIQVGSPTRAGFLSLPVTPTQSGVGHMDWDGEGEALMERVESGRELRVRMFQKLSKENPLNGPGPVEIPGPGPDLGWVSDLIK